MSACGRRLEWTASRGLQWMSAQWTKSTPPPHLWYDCSTVLHSLLRLRRLHALPAVPWEDSIRTLFHQMVVSLPTGLPASAAPPAAAHELVEGVSLAAYSELPLRDRSAWVQWVLLRWSPQPFWSPSECVKILYAVATSCGVRAGPNVNQHVEVSSVVSALVGQVQAHNESLDFFALSAAVWAMAQLSHGQSTAFDVSASRILYLLRQRIAIDDSNRLRCSDAVSMLCAAFSVPQTTVPVGFLTLLGEHAGRCTALASSGVAALSAMGDSDRMLFINGWWSTVASAEQLDAPHLTQLIRVLSLDPFQGATFKARMNQLQVFASLHAATCALCDLVPLLQVVVDRVPKGAVDAMCVRTLSVEVCRRVQSSSLPLQVVGAAAVVLSQAQDMVAALHNVIDWGALQRSLHDAVVLNEAPCPLHCADLLASIFDIDHKERVDLPSLTKLLAPIIPMADGAVRGAVLQAHLEACANSTSPIDYATRAEGLWTLLWGDGTTAEVDRDRCLEALRRLPVTVTEANPTVQAMHHQWRSALTPTASSGPQIASKAGLMDQIRLLAKEPLEAQRRATLIARALAVWSGSESDRVELMCGLIDALPALGPRVGCLEHLFVALSPDDTLWLSQLPLPYSMSLLEGVHRLSGVVDTYAAIEHQVLSSMAGSIERCVASNLHGSPHGHHLLMDEAIATLILIESMYRRLGDRPLLPAGALRVVSLLCDWISASAESLSGRQSAIVATVCVLLDVPQPSLLAHDLRVELDGL